MTTSGLDEMLLDDLPSSQDSTEGPWEEDSEDEMLDAVELPSRNLASSPILMSSDEGSKSINDTESIESTNKSSTVIPVLDTTIRDRDWVITRIESILEDIVDALIEERKCLSITLRTRSGTSGRNFDPDKGIVPADSAFKTRRITFPGDTQQEAWRFTVLVRIIELVHSALVENVVISKRDIYYRHPDLFVKQSVVDRYVDDLACTLGVSRLLLNVAAAAKGLVAGNFTIQRLNGTLINGLCDREGLLVPKILDEDILDLSRVEWILIIEKEATFRSLLSSPHWPKLGLDGLVLTAKGYPDLASRTFLSHLVDHSPHVPLYALVDFDPDGIAIMSNYKYGSYALAHENVTTASLGGRPLNLPRLQWLGLNSCQLNVHPGEERATDEEITVDAQGLMRLTVRDRKKARQMLSGEMCAEQGPQLDWRRELQVMLMLNVKAEMQILEEQSGGISGWLKGALGKGQSGQGLDRGGCMSVAQIGGGGSDDGLLF